MAEKAATDKTADSADSPRQAIEKAIHDTSDTLAAITTSLALPIISLRLNRTNLTIETRSVAGHRDLVSLHVSDLENIEASIGPVFGRIRIKTKVPNSEVPQSIGLFTRKDVVNFKRVTKGYIIAREKNIKTDDLPISELKTLLYKLGIEDKSVK